MADTAALAEQGGGVTDGLVGMLNVFVDPAETARRVPSKLSWLWPVIVIAIAYITISSLMVPYAMQLVDAKMAERNMPPEQLQRAQSVAHAMTKYTAPVSPIFGIGMLALIALLIKAMYSVMGVRPRYRDVFSLLAACALIPMIQAIASYIVVRSKGDEITTSEQLAPPFGLDLFMPGLKGVLFAIVHFFSIFEIWYLVVLTLGFAYLTRSSKSKALIAITPAWLLPLLFAMIGGLFNR
jgi:hypothetical protein